MSRTKTDASLLLDTHIWVDFVLGEERLTGAVRQRIREAIEERKAFVSVISIWEVAFLVRKGRIHLPLGVLRWAEDALRLPGFVFLPLTAAIAVRSVELPQDLNRDPSDRFLVASAEVEQLRLVTRDRNILQFAQTFQIPVMNARRRANDEE